MWNTLQRGWVRDEHFTLGFDSVVEAKNQKKYVEKLCGKDRREKKGE